IFPTVRCNIEALDSLDDPRRLSEMLARAHLAPIIVEDRKTMSVNPLRKRTLDACTEVSLRVDLPASSG
ncbi:hypothetical protein BYT27DRAFT_7003380, partial [Phlegmacium glaucopus]